MKYHQHGLSWRVWHELMQQEAAHPFSSLSLSQFSKIADVLEQMKTYFKITGVEAHVITQ